MKLKTILYSLLIFSFLSCLNNEGISRKLSDLQEDKTEYDLSKAINVYIDGNSKIYVDHIQTDIEGLKISIRTYESENKSEAVITLKTERETMYKTYIEVQNTIVAAIRELRVQLAKEKYNTELDQLTQEQLSEIRKIYPQNLLE